MAGVLSVEEEADLPAVYSDTDDEAEPDGGGKTVTWQDVQQLLRPYIRAVLSHIQNADLKQEQAEMLATSINAPRLDMLLIASYVILYAILIFGFSRPLVL